MNSESFKKLQAKWYRKLKTTGFKDIEDTDSEREMLNTWDSLYFLSRFTLGEFEAKQRYYELATQFLESHMFETSVEKTIWSDWCQGISIREIARRRKSKKYCISAGRRIVRKLEGIMLGRADSNKKPTTK